MIYGINPNLFIGSSKYWNDVGMPAVLIILLILILIIYILVKLENRK